MKRVLFAVAAIAGLCGRPQATMAQATPYLGQIMIFGGNFCPSGWAATNGALLAISQNEALFTLLGAAYGGDGTRTFALPNMQPIYTQTRATFTTCIAIQGVYPSH